MSWAENDRCQTTSTRRKWRTCAACSNGCSALTELDITNFNTANVNDMGDMFRGCSGLKTIDVKHFNTAKVGGMSNMFAECSMMKTLDLANFNTEQNEVYGFYVLRLQRVEDARP